MKSFVRFDDCCWPNPLDPNEIESTMRYGAPNESEALQAASFIAAYKQLMRLTNKEVLYKIKKIKEHQCD